jgi:hypothetical protein
VETWRRLLNGYCRATARRRIRTHFIKVSA